MNRGVKKATKALSKVGMTPLAGVTRVTLRKRDGYIFVIDNPKVLRSGEDGNTFCIFGDIKIDDPNQRLRAAEAARMAEAQAAANKAAQKSAASTAPAKESAKKASGDEAAADESGLTQNHISMVMEHTGCTRNEAIGALRETNDDMVNAVLKLTK